jgi:hypothetical protein
MAILRKVPYYRRLWINHINSQGFLIVPVRDTNSYKSILVTVTLC